MAKPERIVRSPLKLDYYANKSKTLLSSTKKGMLSKHSLGSTSTPNLGNSKIYSMSKNYDMVVKSTHEKSNSCSLSTKCKSRYFINLIILVNSQRKESNSASRTKSKKKKSKIA